MEKSECLTIRQTPYDNADGQSPKSKLNFSDGKNSYTSNLYPKINTPDEKQNSTEKVLLQKKMEPECESNEAVALQDNSNKLDTSGHSMSSPDSSSGKGQRRHSKCRWLVLLVNIVICVVVVILTWIVLIPPEVSNIEDICVQCINLVDLTRPSSEADPLINKLTKRMDNGLQMCCAQNDEQVAALIEAGMRKQAIKRDNQELNMAATFTPVSAHKQLLAVNDSETSLTEPFFNLEATHFLVRLNKTHNDPLTEHARGVEVLDSAIEIKHTGLYYVYLGILVRPRSPKPAKLLYKQSFHQKIHRRNINRPDVDVLLETAHSAYPESFNDQETKFSGGTFYLQKGDLISVYLSGLGMVDYKKESTFVGLYMVESAT